MDATQARRVTERSAVRPAPAPPVLRTERIAEQLVTDDEERVDAEDLAVERRLRKGGVLDQLAGITRIEHAIEILAQPQVDGMFELLA